MTKISHWPKDLLVALARHRFAQLKKTRKKFEKIQLWYKNQILHEGYVETTVNGSRRFYYIVDANVELSVTSYIVDSDGESTVTLNW